MTNTTPQKALQDVIALGEVATDTPLLFEKFREDESLITFGNTGVRAGDFQYSLWCAIKKNDAIAIAAMWNFIRQHGQHFAGLEAALAKSNQSRAKYAGEIGVLQVEVLEMKARAETAEAELAKERELSAAISRDCNECANQRNEALAELARCRAELAADRQALQAAESEKSRILAEFPLFDESGLSEEFHCEWVLHQDRKRLHAMLSGKGTAVYSIHHDYEGCADG